MDDKARIYDDVSWLPTQHDDREQGSGRSRTIGSTAAVMAIAGALGFGGAMLVHDSVTASPSTSTATNTTSTSTATGTTTATTTAVVTVPQTTTNVVTTSGGS